MEPEGFARTILMMRNSAMGISEARWVMLIKHMEEASQEWEAWITMIWVLTMNSVSGILHILNMEKPAK
jgi:hypothetical protein